MVITGASSGIGLATARAAAAQGAKLVLASRNSEVLATVVHEIKAAGGQAIHVVADVAKREEVQRIADEAIKWFGGIDTWVNNAGISIYGRLKEVNDDDHRRLFETNFWGVVHGSLIAVGHLKKRGGALINVGSVASDVSFPLQGMYSASKHAVMGFTDALRIELEEEGAAVSVTLIKPAAIDTPFPQHAKNYMEKEPKLPPPVYAPEEAAYAILHAAAHPEREVYVGGGGKAMSSLNKHAPKLMDWMNASFMSKIQQREEAAFTPQDALYSAGEGGQIKGLQPGYVMKKSIYTRGSLNPGKAALAIAAVGLLAFALVNRNNYS